MATINPTIDLSNFFTNGFIIGDCLNSDDISYLERFNFIDCNQRYNLRDDSVLPPDSLVSFFSQIHASIESNLLKHIFNRYDLLGFGMWAGADEGSQRWHNDFEDGDKFNSNLLIYLEDHSEENHLLIRSANQEHKIMLKKGQFVWINQMKCFQHKAVHKKGLRRLLSFEYFIHGLIK